jgi:hypothetical protein
VQAVSRSLNGSWSTPSTISAPHDYASSPNLVATPAGTFVVGSVDDTANTVHAATRTVGQNVFWSPANVGVGTSLSLAVAPAGLQRHGSDRVPRFKFLTQVLRRVREGATHRPERDGVTLPNMECNTCPGRSPSRLSDLSAQIPTRTPRCRNWLMSAEWKLISATWMKSGLWLRVPSQATRT